MIGVKISEVKIMFNEKAILTPAEKMQRKLLSKFGGYCRTIMRNSIKAASRPGQHSEPGQPPMSHRGRINYKDTIFFVVDWSKKEVVIGGALLSGTAANGQTVPGILEHGGTVILTVGSGSNRRRKAVQIRARPHAGPAFAKAIEKKLPELIENGIMREV